MLVFDIETDGLLDQLTHIKCLNIIDSETGEEFRFNDYDRYEEPVVWFDAPWGDMKLHCLEVVEGERPERTGYINDGLLMLEEAHCIAGQNILEFDIPAIQKIFPEFQPKGRVRDSRVESRVMYTNLKQLDFARAEKGKLPKDFVKKGLVGTHKLESWGLRIGQHQKADFKPQQYGQTWEDYSFSKDCDDYCMDDVRTNVDIFNFFDGKEWDSECIGLENDTAWIIGRQQRYGWLLDVPAVERLTAELQVRRSELHDVCSNVFAPWWERDSARCNNKAKAEKENLSRLVKTVSKSAKRFVENEEGRIYTRKKKIDGKFQTIEVRGWYQYDEAGAEFTPIKEVVFNPGSRDHIGKRLQVLHGWNPIEFTGEGKPKIDETILKALPYPEAQKLAEYFTVQKKLGQASEGKQAWLKFVDEIGRVHGRVNSNGAVTGRMTHSSPNVGQVDSDAAMRACWIVAPGKKLVGCDADGLELRCLGHYMARFDGGAYIKIILEGRKEDGTDIHTMNQKALKLNSRNNAKTWIYAFLYGAGNLTLGHTVVLDMAPEVREKFYAKYAPGVGRDRAIARLGKRSRDLMAEGFPALQKLIESVKKASRRGWLKGLDGRRVVVRSEHAALNTLLQSAGAILMKRALVILDQALSSIYTNSSTCGADPYDCNYEFVGNIHDEFQMEVDEEIADDVGQRAAESIRLAGEYYDFRCPTAGSYDIGENWSATH